MTPVQGVNGIGERTFENRNRVKNAEFEDYFDVSDCYERFIYFAAKSNAFIVFDL